jgi:hypothetical protein
MTDRGLPRRPLTPMQPPIDGLQDVRREAGRRRRRRAAISAASGATVAAAAAAAIVLATETGGLAVLKPVPPAAHLPSSRPAATAHLPKSVASTPDRSGGHRPTSVGSLPTTRKRPATSMATGNSDAVAPARPAQSQQQSTVMSGHRTPYMTRYRSTWKGSGVADRRLCSGVESSDDQGTHHGVGWCPSAIATRVSGGERLTFQICRDSTSGGQLTFSGSREVDLVLRHNGHVVWSWAKVRPGHPDSHHLTAAADGCWNWTLVWPGVTSGGRAAPRGSYTVTASSTAQEVSPQLATADFSY